MEIGTESKIEREVTCGVLSCEDEDKLDGNLIFSRCECVSLSALAMQLMGNVPCGACIGSSIIIRNTQLNWTLVVSVSLARNRSQKLVKLKARAFLK